LRRRRRPLASERSGGAGSSASPRAGRGPGARAREPGP
jgi:hypothetical protein